MSRPPADNTVPPARYVVELRPEPAGRDRWGREPTVRLRLLLKIAGRGLGLRCVGVREASVGSGEATAGTIGTNSP